MFLLHTGLLSPREVKQLGQGHPVSDRKSVTVSFLMMTIIGLFRGKCDSPSPGDLKHIRRLSSEKGQADGRAKSRG